jgi:putative endonuclease
MTGDERAARGRRAESAVADWLSARGCQIVARNYRCRGGELDLVARRGQQLIFVEVKARRDASAYGGTAASITPAKLRRLRHTALHVLQQSLVMHNDILFLAALVDLDQSGNPQGITGIPIEWR